MTRGGYARSVVMSKEGPLEDNATIFSTGLSCEQKNAIKSGEERGKREAMKGDPKRFATARRNGKSIRAWNEAYVRIFGHD